MTEKEWKNKLSGETSSLSYEDSFRYILNRASSMLSEMEERLSKKDTELEYKDKRYDTLLAMYESAVKDFSDKLYRLSTNKNNKNNIEILGD